MKPVLVALATLVAAPAFAEGGRIADINPPETATEAEGLEAFARIFEVTSHPRCSNCHVGADNVPMWSGPTYGRTRPHGMNINAGDSRIGAETLVCSTCHRTDTDLNSEPHAPPNAGLPWQLPPKEFHWFGRTAAEVCAQLSDPARNGGRDWMGLAEHLVSDAGHSGFVLWGWTPGGGREPAPYSLQAHVNDVTIWGVAGQPCPTE